MKTVPVEMGNEGKIVEVSVYENLAEAQKALGEKGLLEHVNRLIIKDARAKEHRVGQLERGKERRAELQAALAFAKEKGFDPKKVKVTK